MIEQGECSVGIDQLLGIIVIGRNFADADVLLQLDTDFRQIM